MTTPFPVPIHKRLHDTISAVILTKEKPSFPVPNTNNVKEHIHNKISDNQLMFVSYVDFIKTC